MTPTNALSLVRLARFFFTLDGGKRTPCQIEYICTVVFVSVSHEGMASDVPCSWCDGGGVASGRGVEGESLQRAASTPSVAGDPL